MSFQEVLRFHFQKTKVLLFNQQNIFKPKFLAQFVLKAFDFNLGAKSISKINFAFKKNDLQLICKQNPCEKDFGCNPFKKN
jgi:hypothetical protein